MINMRARFVLCHQIITINEAKRRQSFSFEDEEPIDLLPVLMDTSALLEDTHIEKVSIVCYFKQRVHPKIKICEKQN